MRYHEADRRRQNPDRLARRAAPADSSVCWTTSFAPTIGDSRLLVSDAMPEMGSERAPTQLGGSPVVLAIHLERAPAADWPGTTTPAKDPFGHLWLAD